MMILFLLALMILSGNVSASGAGPGGLNLQIVRTKGEEILWEASAKPGDYFTIEYQHSSDHTPVRDLFTIGDHGEIILIEESYRWYGAGLESFPGVGEIDLSGDWTRVRMHRSLPYFFLRIGRIANHILTFKGQDVPLLSIGTGGDSVWIRTTKSAGRR